MKQFIMVAISLSLVTTTRATPTAADLAEATVIVYNSAAPDSAHLARFYASERHIPKDHIVGLWCSKEEEISREEYDNTIAGPLRKIFTRRELWTLQKEGDGPPRVTSNQIHFVALIRGMPLKIRSTPKYPGDDPVANAISSQNQASVDSELSLLGLFSKQISGAAVNPYFESFRPIAELNVAPLMLVCRLDAPTAEIVRRMITDSIKAEKNGLWGRAYVDGAHNTAPGLGEGDVWLQTVVDDLRHVGVPVVYDEKSETIPAGFPMDDCALYYGWYASSVTGPFTDPDFSFTPGAIAVHIHSFSATTLRNPGANWVAPLLSKGAAASLGNVYEPFLQLTAHLNIFNDRLLKGFTLAESAYMATRALSWMTVVVGDPLYRPYLSWSQEGGKGGGKKRTAWEMYHEFALKNAQEDPKKYFAEARRAASRAENGPMIEDLGLTQAETGDSKTALSCLQQARAIYKQRDDLLRVVLEQVDVLLQSDEKKKALALVHQTLRMVPESPSLTLLRQIEEKLSPPKPKLLPTASPSPTRF
ncbi:MAG TPA: TIGR03790 family protein [Chthoniobacterales bacterium]|jgi:uncharacterized protein (TIGR03790 family)